MSKLETWQLYDSYGVVSWLVIKAYAWSLLILAAVLVLTVGDDVWTQYFGHSTPLDAGFNSNFTVVDFSVNT